MLVLVDPFNFPGAFRYNPMTVKIVQTNGGTKKTFGPYPIEATGQWVSEVSITECMTDGQVDELRDKAIKAGAERGYAELFVYDDAGREIEDCWEIFML